MTTTTIVVLLFCCALALATYSRRSRKPISWRQRSARRALQTLRKITGEYAVQKRFAYLRKLDPFVFEELVLLCFQQRGLRARRHPYTRDGGLDGTIWLPDGREVFIQSKRYTKHISAEQVDAFVTLVTSRSALGVFVHTGRTGRMSRQHVDAAPVEIVSGERLLQLCAGDGLTLFDVAL